MGKINSGFRVVKKQSAKNIPINHFFVQNLAKLLVDTKFFGNFGIIMVKICRLGLKFVYNETEMMEK